jgi:hypothetical protein
MQVRRSPKKQEPSETLASHARNNKTEEKIAFSNIHGTFDLNKFSEVYHLLTNIIASMHIN